MSCQLPKNPLGHRDAFAIPLTEPDAVVAKLVRQFAAKLVDDQIGEMERIKLADGIGTRVADLPVAKPKK